MAESQTAGLRHGSPDPCDTEHGRLVAGKACRVAHVMGGIMQCCSLHVAGQRHQGNAHHSGEQRRYEFAARGTGGLNHCRRLHSPYRHTRRHLAFHLPGRSPGSRVVAFARLPRPNGQVARGALAHRLQSRGRLRLQGLATPY